MSLAAFNQVSTLHVAVRSEQLRDYLLEHRSGTGWVREELSFDLIHTLNVVLNLIIEKVAAVVSAEAQCWILSVAEMLAELENAVRRPLLVSHSHGTFHTGVEV